MQLDLFDTQLPLFPDFAPVKSEPSNREAPASNAQVCIPFLADIEQLSRRSGYCYASNRHFRESNLSSMFGRTDRTIQRHLKALQDHDMVTVERMGPKRMIFVTTRGMLALAEAGFTPTSTATRQAQPTPTLSPDPDRMSRLPRHSVARPRQNVAHISLSTPIPVQQEEPRAENAKGDVAVKVEEPEPPPKNLRETFEREERLRYGRTFAEIVAEDLSRFDAEKAAKQQAANRSITDDERAELNSWLRGFACAA